MIDEKCKNCEELVIPYFSLWNKSNYKVYEEYMIGTCRCNVDAVNRKGDGYYGWCHPSECHGPRHRYYFDYTTLNRSIKFID